MVLQTTHSRLSNVVGIFLFCFRNSAYSLTTVLHVFVSVVLIDMYAFFKGLLKTHGYIVKLECLGIT